MGIEIERKFLVMNDAWTTASGAGVSCRQGYLTYDPEKTVRVRIMGGKAFLTIKGASNGIVRAEFEYEIPVPDAEVLLTHCDNLVEKTRYFITHSGMRWELDVFEGANEGLILAELELESEQQPFDLPPWAGQEVSGDARYYNACLARHPFSVWSHQP